MIEAAGDGVLVTGQGGDEVFGTWSLAWAWAGARRGRNLRSSLRPLVGAAVAQARSAAASCGAGAAIPALVDTRNPFAPDRGLGLRDHGRGPSLVAGLLARSQFRAGLGLGDAGTSALSAQLGVGRSKRPCSVPDSWPLWRGAADD